MLDDFKVGDSVGVKDSPDFIHWSRHARVTGMAPPSLGSPAAVMVVVEGTFAEIPVQPQFLVRLASPRVPGGATEQWAAQACPIDGDAPGPWMYFASGTDLLTFAAQFQALKLDEVLKYQVPATATDADRSSLAASGAVPA